jgi:hypothetical protein
MSRRRDLAVRMQTTTLPYHPAAVMPFQFHTFVVVCAGQRDYCVEVAQPESSEFCSLRVPSAPARRGKHEEECCGYVGRSTGAGIWSAVERWGCRRWYSGQQHPGQRVRYAAGRTMCRPRRPGRRPRSWRSYPLMWGSGPRRDRDPPSTGHYARPRLAGRPTSGHAGPMRA